jgi:inner membrane protein
MFRHKGAGALAILYEAPLLLVRVVLAIIVDIIAGLLPHRGVTHWGLTWFLLSVLAVLVSILAGWVWVYAAAFSAGYLLHLLGDAMTESGVRLLAPLHNRPIHIIPKMFAFNYDSPIQWAVVVMVWGMALILLRSQGWLGQVAALVEGIR